MATEVFYHKRNRVYRDSVYSAARGSSLWERAPLLALHHTPTRVVDHLERWSTYDDTDDHTLTQATSGAAAISTSTPGVLELDSGSTTQGQGANLQRTGAIVIPQANSKIFAEFDVKVVDTFDKAELFIGLSDVETAILSSQALNSDNVLGWHCVTNDGVLLFAGEKAGTGATKSATTIAEDTWVRLGLLVDGVDTVTQFIDGVEQSAQHVTANIPTVALVPSFVCQSGGTNDPILHIRPYRVLQVFDQ